MELATERTSFARSLRIQLRVIGALLMREIITRYGRANLGFVWLFVEPMIFTLGVTALWAGFGLHKHSALPIVAFGVTGYSSVLLWRNCASRCAMARRWRSRARRLRARAAHKLSASTPAEKAIAKYR